MHFAVLSVLLFGFTNSGASSVVAKLARQEYLSSRA
jgi:hypothetical protein